ncbi:energy-coupling factor ABC transporter ATP-binding protein [Caenibacillus caldisaponilyticus]|uniref:energy-coupling factor ABC transporter ATP-binding protein n=1 Tax=Caenibacillus caldisaponilyticus TaxID=1674942 RepID=UPI0009885FDC|nr:ABC transporter ATP-binding protein [Caenibacillus caldisaponilyticus]
MAEIRVDHVFFSYDKRTGWALNDVSLDLGGESTAFIGQNGAGKSTLMKLLKGLLVPERGDILINGKNTKDTSAAKLAGEIGLIFQNPNEQIFKHKVFDEVAFGPRRIMDAREAEARTAAALRTVGLFHKKDVNPYDLSLSERKLVAAASVLAMDTDIVIFDEPTMGQDEKGIRTLKAILEDLKGQGKLVLAVLHDMAFAAECFERIVVMAHGEILLDGPPEAVFANEEALKKAGVEPPPVMQLAIRCGFTERPVTKESFLRLYYERR